MYVVCATSPVQPAFVDRYVEASLVNARNSRNEPGCLRFDVHRGAEDPNLVFFYEAYLTREDFLAHQQTSHYLTWRDLVKDWLAAPRVGVKYHAVDPLEKKDYVGAKP